MGFLKFSKMHGAGNDYVFIDGSGQSRDWPALAIAMSDRHRGVGGDGIILALPSDHADLRMTMFNADGSEGEMCGNGIRCLVGFAFENGIVPERTSPVMVETLAGVKAVTPIWEGGRMTGATVSMGEPSFAAAEIPVAVPGHEVVRDYPLAVDGHSFEISCVSMGNPHAVAFFDAPVDGMPLHEVGPLVEHHPMFPRRTNFEIVNVVDSGALRVRAWERGSGLTMACGSGAAAAAVIARIHGFTGDEVAIAMPGGDLKVRWPGDGDVVLEGPIEKVFAGEWRR